MKFRPFLILILTVVLSKTSLSQSENKLNAIEIVNKSIDALGGKEYLKSIKTLYTDISTEMEGRQVNWIVKEMLPNKGAFQIKYNDRIVFENWYDGKTGFEIINGEKRKAGEDVFKDKKYKNNIFNELDYIDSTLWKLEFIGEDKVGNENCYKIKAVLVNGLIRMLYFSKETFYILREDKIANKEKDSFDSVIYSDFKKFGNLIFYSTVKFGAGNDAQVGKIEKVLTNENISEKDFR